MISRTSSLSLRRRALGLSLVEILVGVAIGLIGIVAIFQAVSTWSKHTATTSSGSDAQVSGSLALFSIERDLKQAGHGFGRAASAVMGCNVQATDNTAPARVFNFGLRPVDIVTGLNGAPDQIDVLYGNSSFYVEESQVIGSTATTKTLARQGGFKKGDLAIAAFDPGPTPGTATCQLVEITKDDDPIDARVVHHETVGYTSYYGDAVQAHFNSASTPPFTTGTIYNLGPTPQRNIWSIPAAPNNRILVRTEKIYNSTSIQIAEGVVNIKAEYGYDLDGDGQIGTAGGVSEWMTALPLAADYRRVLAIRVAVLVRGRQYERNGDPSASAPKAVTTANPFYFNDVTKTFLMTNIDGSSDSFDEFNPDPNNWRYYRYRVYERVIPLRNALWGTFG